MSCKVYKKRFSVVRSAILFGVMMNVSSLAQSHPVAECMESMIEHCSTWYEDDPVEFAICLTNAVTQCSSHHGSGTPPGTGSDDFTAGVKEAATKYLESQKQLIELRVKSKVRGNPTMGSATNCTGSATAPTKK